MENKATSIIMSIWTTIPDILGKIYIELMSNFNLVNLNLNIRFLLIVRVDSKEKKTQNRKTYQKHVNAGSSIIANVF